MSSSELSTYLFQREQIQEALERDPKNADLLKLHADLSDLISLLEAEAPPPPPTGASHSSKRRREEEVEEEEEEDDVPDGRPRYVVGQTVLAKYHKDDKMYEAKVDCLPIDGKYGVIFSGYSTREMVDMADVRDFDPTQVATPASALTGGTSNRAARARMNLKLAQVFGNGLDRKSKKKHWRETTEEKKKAVETEHAIKQQSWQKFAKGGRGLKVAPPLKKQSMFSTPEDPNAKVGVIGSGKPMTQFQNRGKHIYERTD